MRAADTMLKQVEKSIKGVEDHVVKLKHNLNSMDLSPAQIAKITAGLDKIAKSAHDAADAAADVKIPESAVAQSALASKAIVHDLKEIEDQAKDTSRAMQRVGDRDSFGRFLPGGRRMILNSSGVFEQVGPNRPFAGGGPGASMMRYDPSNLLLQNRVFAQQAQYARNVVRGVENNRPIFADPNQFASKVMGPLQQEVRNRGLFGEQGKQLVSRFFTDMKRRVDAPGGLFGTGGMFGQGGGSGYGGRSMFSQIAALAPGGRRATGGALAGGIAAAAPLVSSLLPAVGVLGTLPAIATGGAVALGAVALAFDGVTKAIGGDLKEYKSLNASQKQFVDLIRGPVSMALDGIRQTVSKLLFPGLVTMMKEIFNPTTIGVFNRVLGMAAQTLSGIAVQIGKVFQNKDFLRTFESLSMGGLQFFARMVTAAIQFGKALGDIGVAALPLLGWMGQMIQKGATFFAQWTGSHAQAMAGFFNQTRLAVALLFRTIGNLLGIIYQLMQILAPLGSLLLDQINVALHDFAKWLEKNRLKIQEVTLVIGRDLINAIKTLWQWLMVIINNVLKPLVTWLFKLGTQLNNATNGVISLTHGVEALVALAAADWVLGFSAALVTKLIPALVAVVSNPAWLALLAGLALLSQYKNGFGSSTSVGGTSKQAKMDMGKANFGGGIVGEIYYDPATKSFYAVGAAGTTGGAESFTKDLSPGQVAKQLGISVSSLMKRVNATSAARSRQTNGDKRGAYAGNAGGHFNPSDVFKLLLNNGVPYDVAKNLATISARGEDPGGYAGTLNNNPNTQDYSVGLFQENFYGKMGPRRVATYAPEFGLSPTMPVNQFVNWLGNHPDAQAQIAYQIYQSQGYGAWTTAKGLGITGGGIPQYSPGSSADPFKHTPGAGTRNTPSENRFARAQSKYLAATGQGSTPRQDLAAARDYLQTLKEIQKTVHTTGGTNVQNLAAQREITSLVRAENVAKKEIAKSEKEIRIALLAQKELNILGVKTGGASVSTLSARAQLDKIKQQLFSTPGLDNTGIQAQVDRLNLVLKMGIANPTVRQAVASNLSTLKQTIRDRLQQLTDLTKQQLSDATQKVSGDLSTLQSAADAAFATVTNAQVQTMQDSLTSNLQNLQVMVRSAAGNFLFGGSVNQTPSELAIAALTKARDVQSRTLALTQAQQSLVLANATGNPQTIFDAQQSVADAQFNITIAGLQDQADVERTAADSQLQAAQNAYQRQQQALIDNYQTQRQIQQTAMDQQVQAFADDMAQYPANTAKDMAAILQIWTDNGVPMHDAAVAFGGQIYNGLAGVFAPGGALDKDIKYLMDRYVALLTLQGTLSTTPAGGPGTNQYETVGGGLLDPGIAAFLGIPHAAKGGIFNTPTVALIGEAGPEAVVPLSTATSAGTLHVTHNITVELDKRQVATAVREEFIRLGRSNKSIFSGPGVTA